MEYSIIAYSESIKNNENVTILPQEVCTPVEHGNLYAYSNQSNRTEILFNGKFSILKLIIGEDIPNNNALKVMPNLKISYVSQITDEVKGTISEYARNKNVDESIFRAMLQKLGVNREIVDKNLSDLSEGQKKKVMIARSISEDSEIYIWDEPLNYLDIQSREQIETMLLKYKPTMLFIEHDEVFINKIASKVINLTILLIL